MSTDLATTGGELATFKPVLPPEIIEKVVIGGDLSKLNPKERMSYVKARCEAAGLNIITRPFEYLVLNGKTVLYATKSCAESLVGLHGLSVEILLREHDPDLGIYSATARATFPSGRFVDDMGVTPVRSLHPADLSNAMMKAITKAKRRAVLSACGLGDVIDESELETVKARPCTPTGEPVRPDNKSGSKTGQYASDEQTDAYVKGLANLLRKRNAEWLDRWTGRVDGELPEAIRRDPLEIHEIDREALRWCVETGRLSDLIDVDEVKARQLGRYTAIVYHRSDSDRDALREVIEEHINATLRRKAEAVYRAHPELDDSGCDPESDAIEPEVIE